MKNFLFAGIIFLIVIFQVSFLTWFSILGGIPNLLLTIVIIWCILRNYKEGCLWGIMGGLLFDLFSGTAFGVNALSLLGTVIFVYFLMQNFVNGDDTLSRIGIIAFATFVYKALFAIFSFAASILHLADFIDFLRPDFLYFFPIEIILNVVLMLLLYNFIKSAYDFFSRTKANSKFKLNESKKSF